jgi:hypothetical protein
MEAKRGEYGIIFRISGQRRWREQGFKLDDVAMARLRRQNVGKVVIDAIQPVVGKNYTEQGLTNALRNSLPFDQFCRYHDQLLRAAKGHSDREKLSFNWHSDWGMITGNNKLKFEYSVQRPEGSIVGYGWADIRTENGKSTLIEGNFYQMPPVEPLFGWMRFIKR